MNNPTESTGENEFPKDFLFCWINMEKMYKKRKIIIRRERDAQTGRGKLAGIRLSDTDFFFFFSS